MCLHDYSCLISSSIKDQSVASVNHFLTILFRLKYVLTQSNLLFTPSWNGENEWIHQG